MARLDQAYLLLLRRLRRQLLRIALARDRRLSRRLLLLHLQLSLLHLLQ
jgi:hypothetical protein